MRKTVIGFAATVLAAACGGDSTGDGSGDASSESTGSASTTLTTTNGSADGSESSTASASASASATADDSGGSDTTTSNGSAEDTTTSGDTGTTTSGDDTTSTSAATAEGSSTSDSDTDTGDVCRDKGMAPEIEFSYIWIANSPEGTVSKINTFTGIEEGRYQSSPEAGPFQIGDGPSRTSVNLLGDVAVANRNGGITKFAADIEDCIDTNANGMIDTSTGPLDVLPWGEDECMLWHHQTPDNLYNEGPRPIAWEAAIDPVTCIPDPNPRLWFGYYEFATNTGFFERVDGNTGVSLDGVDVAWSGLNWGPYGGAVNADGDFWVIGWQTGPTIRIDSDTLTVDDVGAVPNDWFYGMALDQNGDPWVGGLQLHHYDTQAGAWESFPMQSTNYRGLQIDTLGRAFIASNSPCGLAVFDTVAEQVIDDLVPLPGCFTPVGVSIDVEGYVWVVDEGGWAYKVDPDNYNVEIQVEGLVSPYTYSDMTGAGLALQIMPM